MSSRIVLVPCVVVLLSACSCDDALDRAPPASSTSANSASLPAPAATFAKSSARTADPEQALRNLDAQLRGIEQQVLDQPKDVELRAKLFASLMMRSQVLGNSDDLAKAAELAEATPAIDPRSPDAYVLRARGRAALHRFDEALLDLDEAAKTAVLPETKAAIIGARNSILPAIGRYDEALASTRKRAESKPDSSTLGDLAALFAAMARYEEADALFVQAEEAFHGPSAFALSALYFDRGWIQERAGNLTLATDLYRESVRRLPFRVHAATHLAGLVTPNEGIALLEPLTKRSTDPDLFARLGLLKNLVTPGTGDADLAHARARFNELFVQMPYAYADHAGWFWLGAGADPDKALAAAQKNLASRKTADAYELFLSAADATKKTELVCEGLVGSAALPYPTPALKERVRQLEAKKLDCPSAPAPAASGSASAAPSGAASAGPSASAAPSASAPKK